MNGLDLTPLKRVTHLTAKESLMEKRFRKNLRPYLPQIKAVGVYEGKGRDVYLISTKGDVPECVYLTTFKDYVCEDQGVFSILSKLSNTNSCEVVIW